MVVFSLGLDLIVVSLLISCELVNFFNLSVMYSFVIMLIPK